MQTIIDFHSHLGDILYPGGGGLIEKRDIKKKIWFDPITLGQFSLNRHFGLGKIQHRLFSSWFVKAEQARNATATRENARLTMDKSGVTHTVCMPIPPYVEFSDLKKANEKDSGLIPFTGVNFANLNKLESQFAEDVKSGAKGLKLHPIIQKISLTDDRMMHAIKAFSRYELPILFHAGISYYYNGKEQDRNSPENGNIDDAIRMVRRFPAVKFVVGHAGMFEIAQVIRGFKDLSNVWVDTSFQSPGSIRRLIKAFGEDKVLFASDWPFGSRDVAVKAVQKACGGDHQLQRKLLSENAANLLGFK